MLVRVDGRPRGDPADRRHAPARRRRRATTRARRASCSPTRRSAPSTSCSSTSAATTSAASAAPGTVERAALHGGRALQPRHAPRLERRRPSSRPGATRSTRCSPPSRPARVSGAPKIRAMRDHRRARARARAASTPARSATSPSPATSTSASRSARWSSRTAGGEVSVTAGAGIVADSDPGARGRSETENKAAALLARGRAAPRSAERDDPGRRQLRLVHLQPRAAPGGGSGAEVRGRAQRRARPSTSCSRCGPRGIVISPGPGTPEDAGICLRAARAAGRAMPILGVCLGHQALGAVVRRQGRPRAGADARQDLARSATTARASSPACRTRSTRRATTRSSSREATLPAELEALRLERRRRS